jgi:hypothetical protein
LPMVAARTHTPTAVLLLPVFVTREMDFECLKIFRLSKTLSLHVIACSNWCQHRVLILACVQVEARLCFVFSLPSVVVGG